MTYGSTVWHTPSCLPGVSKKIQRRLTVIQNKCLRIISGAFKAVNESILEKESYVPPIPLYLDRLSALAKIRHRNAGTGAIIEAACERIRRRQKSARGRRAIIPPTPGIMKLTWTEGILEEGRGLTERPAKQRIIIKKHFLQQWKKKWSAFYSKTPNQDRVPALRVTSPQSTSTVTSAW